MRLKVPSFSYVLTPYMDLTRRARRPTMKPVQPRLEMETVWAAYRRDLRQVDALLRRHLTTRIALLQEIADYICNSGGKRLRPLLLLMTARLFGPASRQAVILAGAIEFIHTATLLHDDVLDQAELRRGKKAVRSLWGNPASILVGDYIYSRAVMLAVGLKNQEISDTLSATCKRMVEGEAMQLSRNGDIQVSEADYLRMIRNKTAALIEAACHLGGIVGGASSEQKRALARFGINLGIAFQVADDTLDYAARNETMGKARGQDLLDGKVTLPLLHLLQHCRRSEQARVYRIFKANGTRDGQGPAAGLRVATQWVRRRGTRFCGPPTDEVIAMMHRCGSLEYALSRARLFVQRAKEALAIFPDSPPKHALFAVADYVIARDH